MQAQRNPIVWACISVRLLVFSEIRFAFQSSAGKPGKLFGTQELQILEHPWPQATTGDLLARMEVDASMYGNSYWMKTPASVVRLNPNGSPSPRRTRSTPTPAAIRQDAGRVLPQRRAWHGSTFLPNEVCHYRPVPDPAHEFRGASWLNALLPDVIADMDLTDYKHAFLKNAATPNLVVTFQPGVSQEAFNKFRDKMESAHTGPQSGFKTLYLGAGADVKWWGPTSPIWRWKRCRRR